MTRAERPISKEATGAEPAHITSLIRFIAIAFIGGCLVAISKAVPRDTASFEWTNRMGVLLLLTLTVSYAIKDVWATLTGKRSTESWIDRWVAVLISVLIPGVLLLKGWDRVLDALWLK
jgi:hypothetical protein